MWQVRGWRVGWLGGWVAAVVLAGAGLAGGLQECWVVAACRVLLGVHCAVGGDKDNYVPGALLASWMGGWVGAGLLAEMAAALLACSEVSGLLLALGNACMCVRRFAVD